MNNEMIEFMEPFNIATTMTQLIGQLTIIYANNALPKLKFATEKRYIVSFICFKNDRYALRDGLFKRFGNNKLQI